MPQIRDVKRKYEMALKSFLASLEGLEDNISSLYKEVEGGGYLLDAEDVVLDDGRAFGVANYGGLKSALSKSRAELKESKSFNKQFDGFDMEAAKAAMEFQAKYNGKTNDDFDARVDAMRQEITDNFQAKLDLRNQEYEDLSNKHKQHIVSEGTSRTLSKYKDRIKDDEVAQEFFRKDLESRSIYMDDGSIAIAGDDGQPITSMKSSEMGPMRQAEYMDSLMSNEKYNLFLKPVSQGTGTGGKAGGTPQMGAKITKDEYYAMPAGERQDYWSKNQDYVKSQGW